MKTSLLTLLLLCAHAFAATAMKPNIVLIFADDLGERHDLANSISAKRDELLDDLLA